MQFVEFVSGSSTLPSKPFVIQMVSKPKAVPSSHTCHCQIDLAKDCEDYDTFKKRMKASLKHGTCFEVL
ncbi:MAG: hypothetical protein HY861_02210 [Chlamydiia bacterium]|nr:hypothetical protein [Chlamydiia bacterium]